MRCNDDKRFQLTIQINREKLDLSWNFYSRVLRGKKGDWMKLPQNLILIKRFKGLLPFFFKTHCNKIHPSWNLD